MSHDRGHYHLHTQVLNKGAGQSAAAKFKYIHRLDKYEKCKDLMLFSESGNMPSFAADQPIEYWVAADTFERENGRVCREIEFALPRDLTREQQIELIREYVSHLLDGENLPYTWVIHEGDGNNPHCHLIFHEKTNDGIYRDAAVWFKQHNPKRPLDQSGPRKSRTTMPKKWLKQIRKDWARIANQALERVGSPVRIDHRTLIEQGIDREPQRHVGPAGRGGPRAEEAIAHNAEIAAEEAEIMKIQGAIDKIEQAAAERQRGRELDRDIMPPVKASPPTPPAPDHVVVLDPQSKTSSSQREQPVAPLLVAAAVVDPSDLPADATRAERGANWRSQPVRTASQVAADLPRTATSARATSADPPAPPATAPDRRSQPAAATRAERGANRRSQPVRTASQVAADPPAPTRAATSSPAAAVAARTTSSPGPAAAEPPSWTASPAPAVAARATSDPPAPPPQASAAVDPPKDPRLAAWQRQIDDTKAEAEAAAKRLERKARRQRRRRPTIDHSVGYVEGIRDRRVQAWTDALDVHRERARDLRDWRERHPWQAWMHDEGWWRSAHIDQMVADVAEATEVAESLRLRAESAKGRLKIFHAARRMIEGRRYAAAALQRQQQRDQKRRDRTDDGGLGW